MWNKIKLFFSRLGRTVGNKKKYPGDITTHEERLKQIMAELGVVQYRYDWTQGRSKSDCWVEMELADRSYRFENSSELSRMRGDELTDVSDLFASIVYTLECMSKISGFGIISMEEMLVGLPALPDGSQNNPSAESDAQNAGENVSKKKKK